MRRRAAAAIFLCAAQASLAAAPRPADWVPVRWPWSDAKSLDLLASSPVNCLLLETYTAEFLSAASSRGIVTLAVIVPGGDTLAAARRAFAAQATGVVLEGDFAEGTSAAVREAAGQSPVIELSARNRMALDSTAPVLGTYQGVWPGIAVEANGTHRAGPSGSAWIDTNTGFMRIVRAANPAALWIANRPPAGAIVPGVRYLAAIADAAISGARWVVALDPDFAKRLHSGDEKAAADWQRINQLLGYFEHHAEWRTMQEYGQLAVVQDLVRGGLLSGGILDMIATKHTPVRAVPLERLSPDALKGATMAVDVDADALTPAQKAILRDFARSGGTLLTGPPRGKDSGAGRAITLDKAEQERLNDMWRDVNSMVARKDQGVRLYNVASMLSNVLTSADGKTEVVHLVNYSDYPVENVTLHFAGDFDKATLLTPEGTSKKLETYPLEEGKGVDLDQVGVCGTILLERGK